MSFDSNFAQHMIGVYRHGRGFRVFPQPGMADWSTIANHEFTHECLAVATLSGLVHHVLAFLAYQSSSERKQHWRDLYEAAIASSIETHEAAATYCSLVELVGEFGAEATFVKYGVPEQYQRWYSLLDRVLPHFLTASTRAKFGRAIALYAFDDPHQKLSKASWEDIASASNCLKLVPDVDVRFHRLLELIRPGVLF
jgi:hypothetical protein